MGAEKLAFDVKRARSLVCSERPEKGGGQVDKRSPVFGGSLFGNDGPYELDPISGPLNKATVFY
jgi:hypothetical protein